jgi:hypothetical protein
MGMFERAKTFFAIERGRCDRSEIYLTIQKLILYVEKIAPHFHYENKPVNTASV